MMSSLSVQNCITATLTLSALPKRYERRQSQIEEVDKELCRVHGNVDADGEAYKHRDTQVPIGNNRLSVGRT